MKPLVRCLDLFCCGGGAGTGYSMAGMEVTGVDIDPQPQYPFAFVQSDAVEFLCKFGHEFDFIHASPPCQGYSSHVSSRSSKWVPHDGKDEPRLIAKVRDALREVGKPYVIENVMGARSEMNATLMLCGTMFGLPIARHRLFETSFMVTQPEHDNCRGVAKKYAARRGWEYRDMSCTGKGRRKGTAIRWAEVLGVSHAMTQHQLAECIPPAYTRWIGEQFLSMHNDDRPKKR
jgi:DNA (cytosine-5)-methyltransferase 1